jgi:hypothetical protein
VEESSLVAGRKIARDRARPSSARASGAVPPWAEIVTGPLLVIAILALQFS